MRIKVNHKHGAIAPGLILVAVVIVIFGVVVVLFVLKVISALKHIDERRQQQETNNPPDIVRGNGRWMTADWQTNTDGRITMTNVLMAAPVENTNIVNEALEDESGF